MVSSDSIDGWEQIFVDVPNVGSHAVQWMRSLSKCILEGAVNRTETHENPPARGNHGGTG